MRQSVSFLVGIAAALTFWYFILNLQVKQAMTGRDSNHAFLPPFFLSCLIFILCYGGVSWLFAKNRRISRENLLRAAVSYVAGLVASVAFWVAAAVVTISLRRPGASPGNGLFPMLFLG